MPPPPPSPSSDPPRRPTGRRRLLVAALAALMVTYAIFALRTPDFLNRTQAGWLWLFTQDQGVFAEPRILAPEDMVLEIRGIQYLNGGGRVKDHFDITEFRLDPAHLKYGLGREHFQAPTEPRLVPHAEVIEWFYPDTRVLLVAIGDEAHIYPIPWIQRHEVVNDVVGGVPVFAAYCVLANLGAVYDRRLTDEHTLTFAVSGYTYSDPEVWDGMDAFVLWDRETESLWWPPSGRAVSGPLVDRPLTLLDDSYWERTTWGEAIARHPDAMIFEPGQKYAPPRRWPHLDAGDIDVPTPNLAITPAIAPRWDVGRAASRPEAEMETPSETASPTTSPAADR